MNCDRIETAEEGHKCKVCHQRCDQTAALCTICSSTISQLNELQESPLLGDSIVHVLTSLQKWARDMPAWDLIKGLDMLLQPSNQRQIRPTQPGTAPFVVIEGAEYVGKTFHTEGVASWLAERGFLFTFHNNQTHLGRFLKRALKEQIPLSYFFVASMGICFMDH